ncbi:spermidine synthase [Kytococcus sp. Marseille-QA3725]
MTHSEHPLTDPTTTRATPSAQRTVHLSTSGVQARIAPAEHGGGYELFVGGHVQSHIDPADPLEVRYEYLRRMANVLDAVAHPGDALRVLHLGAGALTLPRYLQATRPGSEQVVVDIDRELVSFVTAVLPLPGGTDLHVEVADAREAVQGMVAAGEEFAVVVVDLPTDTGECAHLAGPDFHAELLDLLDDQGLLMTNIGADDGLAFLADQLRALGEVADAEGYDGVWTLADAGMLERRTAGNAVLVAGSLLDGMRESLTAAGPHPGVVLDPGESAALAERLEG